MKHRSMRQVLAVTLLFLLGLLLAPLHQAAQVRAQTEPSLRLVKTSIDGTSGMSYDLVFDPGDYEISIITLSTIEVTDAKLVADSFARKYEKGKITIGEFEDGHISVLWEYDTTEDLIVEESVVLGELIFNKPSTEGAVLDVVGDTSPYVTGDDIPQNFDISTSVVVGESQPSPSPDPSVSPSPEPSVSPSPEPSVSPSPEPSVSPSPTPSPSPSPTPSPTPTPDPSVSPSPSPTPEPSEVESVAEPESVAQPESVPDAFCDDVF